MDILICTYGRSDRDRQHTLKSLGRACVPTLVVQDREKHLYMGYDNEVEMRVLPPSIQTITPTRDYIVHDMEGADHVVMMDDDLHFAVRRGDEPTKFLPANQMDIEDMLTSIDHALKLHPMVGIGAREGGNRVTEPVVYNTRIMRVIGVRRSYFKKKYISFAPMEVMEDFHANLQVLRSGQDTCVLNSWVSNQAEGSGAPGGCSEQRSMALQSACARKLAGLHPGFVRVVQKAGNTGWGGVPRDDVVVQWKQARKSAL